MMGTADMIAISYTRETVSMMKFVICGLILSCCKYTMSFSESCSPTADAPAVCAPEESRELNASALSTLSTTPDAMMTGRNRIARTRLRPWNFWLSRLATKKLNRMTTGTLISISRREPSTIVRKSGSTAKI